MKTTSTALRSPSSRLRVVSALAVAWSLLLVPAAAQSDAGSFDRAGREAADDLVEAKAELSQLRKQIEEERVPLSRELVQLEGELGKLRQELDDLSRELDTKTLALNNERSELKAFKDENRYLSSLLGEYIRNFETRIHISELQRYRDQIESAKNAPDNPNLTPDQVFDEQAGLVMASVERLGELSGGIVYPGTAVGEDGVVRKVDFALMGPVAYFHSPETGAAGVADQKLNSSEPNMVFVEDPTLEEGIEALVTTGDGRIAFDASLGKAQKIEETQDTLVQHIQKGGPVMVPILGLFAAAILVSLIKWFQLMRVPTPSSGKIELALDALKRKDYDEAKRRVGDLRGPTGEMLRAGMEHVRETRELVEEVMFEKLLETKLRLNSYLPFVAIAAAAAPLMGLLGTVTGIINTFKLITVQGTGDPKALSSGISEALITTEFGLIVAIPSLLLHAYLARKARNLSDGMEKTAVSFLNRLSVTGGREDESKEAAGA